jgi:hypothetical protein
MDTFFKWNLWNRITFAEVGRGLLLPPIFWTIDDCHLCDGSLFVRVVLHLISDA